MAREPPEEPIATVATGDRAVSGPRDFPYYGGLPVNLSLGKWLLILGLAAAGYVALTLLGRPPNGQVERSVGILLFVALPIIGLRLAAPSGWTALFRPPTWRDAWIGLTFVPVVLAAAILPAIVLIRFGHPAPNLVASTLTTLKGMSLALFLIGSAPQIFGEELLTILLFLGTLTLFRSGLGKSRRTSIVGAWLLSACLFGLLHLPAYNWQFVQVLLIVGAARLALTIPYLMTKNIWASTITHLTHDWIIFAALLVFARGA